MDDLGGLDMYQKASTLGQSKQRGGDSSKWLIPILESCHPNMNKKVRKKKRGCVFCFTFSIYGIPKLFFVAHIKA